MRVEIGMIDQMVLESLGAPDRTAAVGEEEEWSYGVNRSVGEGGIVRALVYFVYFKEGRVVRTTGSWSSLGYWIYSTSVD
jgi:hypothetical protein